MEKLKHPPLIEAICEIIFLPTAAFDLTLPGIVYTEIKDEFPIKQDRPFGQAAVRNTLNPQQIEVISAPLTQFFSSERNKVVQIGKDILVNNSPISYVGWDDFKSQILRIFKIYRQNQTNHTAIRQITLKYVNQFDVPEETNYKDLFSFHLPNPPSQQYEKNYAFNTVVEYPHEPNVLSKAFRSVFPTKPNTISWVLELGYLNIVPGSIADDDLGSWLETGHTLIEDLFVNALKKTYFESIS
jgi:uncharacterized protein (TIGR04255 family)